MIRIILCIIMMAILTFLSLILKFSWLDKSVFNVTSVTLDSNNLFFIIMFILAIFIWLQRLIKDYGLLKEIYSVSERLKNIDQSNIGIEFNEVDKDLSNTEKYKNLSFNWIAFIKSLIKGDNGEFYQGIDAKEYFNKENLMHDRMNLRWINYSTQLFVGLGMLGTFLGLSMGLADLNLDSGDMKQLVTLIKGTKTAFFTSLYGMYFSIILSIFFNVYLGLYENLVLNLEVKMNSLFKKYNKNENYEILKNELKKVQENTHTLSINVGKELVKGVKEYNESSKEHLANLTKLVDANINNLANDVSKAFEEKLEKIFSMEFVSLFISMKDQLIQVSKENNDEIEKYRKIMVDMSKNMVSINNHLQKFLSTTLNKFEELLSSIQEKESKINNVINASREIQERYNSMLETTKTVMGQTNHSLKNLKDISEIYLSYNDKEKSLVDFWSNNKLIMENLTKSIEDTKVKEIEKIDLIHKQILDRIDEHVVSINDKISKQEEKITAYYQKGISQLFEEYDSNLTVVVTKFKDIMEILAQRVTDIEDCINKANNNFVENNNIINDSQKQQSINYKSLMNDISNISNNINGNLVETAKLIDEKNDELKKFSGDISKLFENVEEKVVDYAKRRVELELKALNAKKYTYTNKYNNIKRK